MLARKKQSRIVTSYMGKPLRYMTSTWVHDHNSKDGACAFLVSRMHALCLWQTQTVPKGGIASLMPEAPEV